MTPSPSRPMRFRRARVLLVGLGDVGQRSVQRLNRRVRVLATTSQPQRVAELRGLGVTPLVLNL
ncbi:MAG: SDR family NAD(P)-dependent oxidoreductase, partial [Burkholderiaceae bacterium]